MVTRDLPDYSAPGGLLGRLVEHDPQRYPGLLLSSASATGDAPVPGGSTPVFSHLKGDIARYDILFAFPQQRLRLDHRSRLQFSESSGAPFIERDGTFFEAMSEWFSAEQCRYSEVEKPGLPFRGGWCVYLGYEMAGEVEPGLHLPRDDSRLPMAQAWRVPAALIHDRHRECLTLVAESACAALLDVIEADIRLVTGRPETANRPLRVRIEEDAENDYLKQVETIQQYIVDGDIFQANLSRQWRLEIDHDGSDEALDRTLFDRLARNNPASFAAWLRFDSGSIISSSPERLVSMRGGQVETRPIAGTRPRSRSREEDERLAAELLAHPKERAEHIMLIDLERNDLGRVCVPGSIHVNELMVLESWQHVHHIVSNVRGQCDTGRNSVDVLKAVFPGGTITGCPKVRCMEILAEQETVARGPYTGSLGYINLDGDMDFNILIRTLVREGDTIRFRAGGGIVADSIAENELQETRAKARGLLAVFAENHGIRS